METNAMNKQPMNETAAAQGVEPLPPIDLLREVNARRLDFLLERRVDISEWRPLLDKAMKVTATDEKNTTRLRYALLLLLASGRILHRVHGISWEEISAYMDQSESADRNHFVGERLSRAFRLLKTMLRAGCQKRGEYVAAEFEGGQ